jgi:hypothetical protein
MWKTISIDICHGKKLLLSVFWNHLKAHYLFTNKDKHLEGISNFTSPKNFAKKITFSEHQNYRLTSL